MIHRIKDENGTTVVTFEGDVDLESSPEARRILLDCLGRTSSLLVDLSAVTYIDSSGIASLVESFQNARKAGRHFALVAVSGSVLSVLRLSRLDKVFTIYDTLEDGLARAG